MLDLLKQRVFLADPLLELVTLRLPVRTDFHQRGEPESGRPVIVLDDVGIGVDKRRFTRPRVRSGMCRPNRLNR